MSLKDSMLASFDENVRKRGEDYLKQHRVLLESYDEDRIEFSVRGKRVYDVELRLNEDDSDVEMSCSCEHFLSGQPCKHLWASILFADSRALAQGWIDSSQISKNQTQRKDSQEGREAEEAPSTSKSTWYDQVLQLQKSVAKETTNTVRNFQRGVQPRLATYAIDVDLSDREQKIHLRFYQQEVLKNGAIGNLKPLILTSQLFSHFADPQDREIFLRLVGAAESSSGGISSVTLSKDQISEFLPKLAATGRLMVLMRDRSLFQRENLLPYEFQDELWSFKLVLRKIETSYFLQAVLSNGLQSKWPHEIRGQVGPLLFFETFSTRVKYLPPTAWLEYFKRRKEIEIPGSEIDAFLKLYFQDPNAPEIQLPDDLAYQEADFESPKVRMVMHTPADRGVIEVELYFVYGVRGEYVIRPHFVGSSIYDSEKKLKIPRDFEFERGALESFRKLGPIPPQEVSTDGSRDGAFHRNQFLDVVEWALQAGWEVIADQKKVVKANDFKIHVRSGVDWFDLQSDFHFDGHQLTLPDLLEALQKGERWIALGNGEHAILPQDWLRRFTPLLSIGKKTSEGLRLTRVQALFLSSLMNVDPGLQQEQAWEKLQSLLEQLRKIEPQDAPEAFKGQLRAYQKKGFSWLETLTQNHLGGILADEMGLGKTVQILALLSKKNLKAKKKPHLVVAPKSLIFNWAQEVSKFAPHLKVLTYTGGDRAEKIQEIQKSDLVLTTYHSLRLDIDRLKDFDFDAFILDEAHLIKNSDSQSSMACRLIRAETRIALTGTPVENAISDLFSILAVVVPGLMTQQQALKWGREKDSETLKGLANALKPFILRRTKEQVLPDLPPKVEQVLYCELTAVEKKKYNELKEYYWAQLTNKFAESGFQKSKIEVLEALLRLRQASCHPGLLDPTLSTHLSSKFELLIEQVEAVIQDGHKALIFSQFTSLLSLLKPQLEKRGLAFEYLDGQTQDRHSRVENFQTNPKIPLFLLSLKAGGVGLNLTAADSVFILDPWWNPAAEAQAIDRTHRIGQTKKVFAYKLIAKGTVEEKILDLQNSKKELAKTLISDEGSFVKNLSLEEIQSIFRADFD